MTVHFLTRQFTLYNDHFQIVGLLANAVVKNLPTATGQESAALKPKLLQLMGRITAAVSSYTLVNL